MKVQVVRSNRLSSCFSIFATLLFLLSSSPSYGFVSDEPIPLLERTITIDLEQIRLDEALKKISAQAGFTFSYNPTIVDINKIITHQFTAKTVREVLDEIFNGTIQYKSKGKYIILTKPQISAAKDQRIVTGYVLDEATGKRLQNVSVYDPVTLSSAVTDSYGFFRLKVDQPSGAEVKLAISKLHYTDTVIAVVSSRQRLLNIPIRIDDDKRSMLDSVRNKLRRFWETKIRTPQAVNMENIRDTLYRKVQFSVVPFIGTNHKLSGNVINAYSFNLYGGYSLGVEKFEVAGLFNIVRGDVNGLQLAGIFNAVGGKTNFVQFAGLFNMNRDTVHGHQFAGLMNLNARSSEKFSMAGLFNFTAGNSRGVHLAGLGNGTIGKQEGPHIAGLFNFSTKDTYPLQLSSWLNFTAGSMRGAQVSGLINFSNKDMTGGQVAGLINFVPKKITGAQVSGLLNYATNVHGTQVGLINVTDSIHGVPVGFLSFVLKGYHKVEISADEIFYTNLALRTGVRQFYNIFTVGAKPDTFEKDETLWTFGYGIGTAPKLSRTLSLNIDVTASQVVLGKTIEEINMINKIYLGLEVQALKNIGITFGVTLNGYVTDTTYDKYPTLFTDYTPNFIVDKTYSNDLNMKMWWGGKIGVRFF